jgi:hypothetical protein
MEVSFSQQEYDSLMEETFAKLKMLGELKGGEYAAEIDRLDNFRRNGRDCGVTMETCWRIYAGKHWDAITTYIRDIQTGKQRNRLEALEGRADDLMVYLLLFKCMVRERNRNTTQE